MSTSRRRAIALVSAGASVAVLVGLATGTTTAVLGARPAAAHATLQSTEPSGGSTVLKSPAAVTLHFDEQVEVSFGSVRVYNTKASRVDAGEPAHPAGDDHAVRLGLPRLANGSYVVTWRVLSADAHPVHGAFTFRVGAGEAADTSSLTRRLLASDGGHTSVGAAFAIDRFLAFASVLALIGGTVFILGPWPEGRGNRRASRVLWIAWSTAVVCTLVGIPLQGLYAGALPLSDITDTSIVSSVMHTRFGKVWLARAIALGLLAPVLQILVGSDERSRKRSPGPALIAGAAIGGIVLASSFGLASHPGTGSMVPLAVLADTTHVGAASVWLGGLLLLAVCVLAGRSVAPANAATTVRRFSPIAFWAVAAIAASGLYQGWREVGSIDALMHTTYGRLLIIKLVLFAVLLGLAAISRSWVRYLPTSSSQASSEPVAAPVLVGAGPPSVVDVVDDAPAAPPSPPPTGPDSLQAIRRSVAAEVAVAIGVLIVTSLLVSAQPGRTSLAQPYTAELDAKSVLINVTFDPAKAGKTTVHAYTLSPEGAVMDVQDLTAVLALPGKDIGPLTVPLRRTGTGHFAAYGFDLPIPGRWKLTVKALLTDIDEASASTTIPVR